MQLDSETGKLEALRVDGTLGNAGLFDSLWTRPSNLAVSSTEPGVLALATPFDGPSAKRSHYTGLAILDPTENCIEVLDLPRQEVLGNDRASCCSRTAPSDDCCSSTSRRT